MSTPPPDRPARYLRAGAWLTILRRLHQMGWTDPRIAEALSRLTAALVDELDQSGWNSQSLDAVLTSAQVKGRFTTRQVGYWRRQLGLPAITQKRYECGSLIGTRRASWDIYAFSHGWGHYVGRSEEISDRLSQAPTVDEKVIHSAVQDLGPGWTPDLVRLWQERPWNHLRRRETQILTALEETGPLTQEQLRKTLSPESRGRNWRSGRTSWLDLLRQKGMVRSDGRRGPSSVYSLAEGVHRHRPRTKTPTSLDRLLKTLGLVDARTSSGRK